MRRFIDVDVLETDVEYWENHDDPKKPDYDTRDIEQVIGSQPIVDAVEVVRCKDCKYASPNGKYGCKAYHFKLYETHEMEANDFCSRGERRENE